MAETVLLKEIKHVLSQFPQYWDNDILLKNRVSEDLRNYDPNLITALLSNEKIKEDFEISINDTSIFKIEEFIQMLTYKDFWEDSYTKYSNKIGLTAGGKYLDYNSDVVLDFPFKDCILEGGMTKEEVGKKEVYYNKVIARDEVDTLLSPKVLTNTKKYTIDGEEEVSEITDTDNLILKGNNLLALHSLKERYTGKVKCIYIDPPYNTGGDSFKYNDRFNHSTWLTFMKNRLEVARELLSDDGLIFVQIDYNEDAYVKVLMDSIFENKNYISTITVKSNSISGNKTQHKEKTILKNKDTIHVYQRGIKAPLFRPQYSVKDEWDTHYNSILIKENGLYTIKKLKDALIENNIINRNETVKPSTLSNDSFRRFIFEERDSIFRFVNSIPDDLKKLSLKTPEKIVYIERKDGTKVYAKAGKRLSFLTSVYQLINGKYELGQLLGDLWTDIDFQNTQNQGHVSFTSAKKPEQLIRRIIEMCSNENDIVLDFFMGSATTQAVAMKMNRQFIGIEQMDYINTVSVPRLQKVIEGEQGGISKDVNWQGGGSFIYTELMDLNNQFIKQIQEAKTSSELLELLETIKKYADLNYLVELDKLTNEPIIIDEDTKETLSFEELPLEKQKKLLIDVMDINQLYVNYSEIDDDMYHVSEQDKAFNRSFYEEGDN